MKHHRILCSLAVLFLWAASAASKETEADSDADETDVVRGFIQYRYLVIGGGLRDGKIHRAKIRIFEKEGKLMIERTEGGRSETVELVRTKEMEGPATWSAKFPKLELSVSYLVSLYHDNFAVLFGEVSRAGRGGKSTATVEVETAYPDIYEPSEAEQDDADQPATAVDSKAGGHEKLKPESEERSQ